MDIVEQLRKSANKVYSQDGYTFRLGLQNEAANEIERLRGALQQIADIEHEDIPAPKTPNEGVTWTVLAMAVGLAEKALKEGE
jgi:hypothetical protein